MIRRKGKPSLGAGNSGRVASSRRAGKLREDFRVLGEPVDGLLREDHLAVDDDVEDPAAAFDQLRVDSGLGLDFFRQTGGRRQVVSLHAIRDRNLHRNLRSEWNSATDPRLWRN